MDSPWPLLYNDTGCVGPPVPGTTATWVWKRLPEEAMGTSHIQSVLTSSDAAGICINGIDRSLYLCSLRILCSEQRIAHGYTHHLVSLLPGYPSTLDRTDYTLSL